MSQRLHTCTLSAVLLTMLKKKKRKNGNVCFQAKHSHTQKVPSYTAIDKVAQKGLTTQENIVSLVTFQITRHGGQPGFSLKLIYFLIPSYTVINNVAEKCLRTQENILYY